MRVIDRCGPALALLMLAFATVSAPAQDRPGAANASTEGQWWVRLSVYTKAEGESFVANPGTPHTTSHSAYHREFSALAFFTVGSESRFSFDERRSGFLHIDGAAQSAGGSYSYSADYQPILKGDGLITSGTVKLLLKWTGGNGTYSTNGRVDGTQTVSADGLHATLTGSGGSHTIPVDYWSSEWQFERTSVSPPLDADDRYETITYRMTRPAMLPFHPNVGAPALPVTEEIEVTHLHPVRREGAQPPSPHMADVAVMLSAIQAGTAANSAAEVKVGEAISLAAMVTNRGPSSARRVAATLAIPPALTLDGLPVACRRTSPGTVRCELGDLASGASQRIEFAVKARHPSVPMVTALIESMTSDPDHTNNVARANIKVVSVAAEVTPPAQRQPAPAQRGR
jgi:hypothetical protein